MKKLNLINLIDAIKVPFRKEKDLYRSLFSMLGFYPRHIQYYKEALVHRSMGEYQEGRYINNERLEFLGDAILDAVVADVLFHQYKKKREGFLTSTRSKIVQRETLGKVAVMMGLDKRLQSHTNSSAHNSYLAGNAFEALVGAIYLDRGYDFCLEYVRCQILNHYLDIGKMASKEVNFKSRLLEWSQKNKVQVNFELIKETKDESGTPVFKSRVLLNDIECGRGTGYSKKESQQKACHNALNNIKKKKTFIMQSPVRHNEV